MALVSGNFYIISAHADGGPRSQVCARETLRSAPHRDERKFFGAHVCRIALNYLPQPIRRHIQNIIAHGKFSTPCSANYALFRWVGWAPEIIFLVES